MAKVAIGDPHRDLLRGLAGQVATPGVAQLLIAVPVSGAGGNRADVGVGAVCIDRQHQPFG